MAELPGIKLQLDTPAAMHSLYNRRIHFYTSLVRTGNIMHEDYAHSFIYNVFLHDVHERCVQVDLFLDSLFNKEMTELYTKWEV